MEYKEFKNKNEYQIDDKRFIKEIKRCSCLERKDGKYTLSCKINERGEHVYNLSDDQIYISKDGIKKFWLGKKAKGTVVSAVNYFEDAVSFARTNYAKAEALEYGLTIYYKRNPSRNYDFVVEIKKGDEINLISIKKGLSIEWMIKEVDSKFGRAKGLNISSFLFDSNNDTINHNPLYISALKNNDKLMEKQLKLYYRIASDEDCSWFAKFLGLRVLPSLSEVYDRNYVVDLDHIDVEMLNRSGYCILHRPYFAMKNSTHSKWQLNPHTKLGVDAALIDSPSIAFCDYLELFDDKKAIHNNVTVNKNHNYRGN